MDALWADAAAAATLGADEGQTRAGDVGMTASSAGVGEVEEYVYDEYAVLESDETGEGEGGEGAAACGDRPEGLDSAPEGWVVPEIDIWWEEEEDSDVVRQLEAAAGWGMGGSDSEGEVDYPDEESGDDNSDDEDDDRGRQRHRFG